MYFTRICIFIHPNIVAIQSKEQAREKSPNNSSNQGFQIIYAYHQEYLDSHQPMIRTMQTETTHLLTKSKVADDKQPHIQKINNAANSNPGFTCRMNRLDTNKQISIAPKSNSAHDVTKNFT
mgnify:CR=1 FL=1